MTDDYCRQEHKCSDNNNITDNNKSETETLRALFTPSKTDDTLHNSEPKQLSEMPDMPSLPKPGQKYWLSSEAKKRKNEYMREYYIRKKEALLQLQEHQLKPRDLKLLMLNDQVVSRHLESDGDYVKVIEDLLGTLLDNKLLKDYGISDSLAPRTTYDK